MIRLVLAVALLWPLPAHADQPDCTMVRSLVAQHGKIAAYAWALANGYSP
jgi:hypothetical protein